MQVNESADSAEIKKAYRRLAMQYHPDVNNSKEANALFVLLNQAYTVLSDEQRRKKYDAMLRYGFKNANENAAKSNPTPTKFEEDKGRKYGTQHKYDKNQKHQKRPPRFSKKDLHQIRMVEDFLFYSLIGLGLISIILATRDLIFNEWEGFNSLSGLIFGLSFSLLLFYIWFHFYKNPKQK